MKGRSKTGWLSNTRNELTELFRVTEGQILAADPCLSHRCLTCAPAAADDDDAGICLFHRCLFEPAVNGLSGCQLLLDSKDTYK